MPAHKKYFTEEERLLAIKNSNKRARAKYQKRHKERLQESRLRYRAKNREKINKQHREYVKAKGNPYSKRARNKKRQWLLDLKKAFSCIKCSENHPGCLQFHHRDPSTKLFSIGNAIRSVQDKIKIMNEIEKCDVLCANCHAKLHYAHLSLEQQVGA